MGILSGITDLTQKVIKPIGDVVDSLTTTEEEKGEIKTKIESIINETLRVELAAKERIMVAELSQGDKFTKRARPSFIYLMLGIISANVVLVPIANGLLGINIQAPIPTELWTLFGIVMSVYSLGRSGEKAFGVNKITKIISDSLRK